MDSLYWDVEMSFCGATVTSNKLANLPKVHLIHDLILL